MVEHLCEPDLMEVSGFPCPKKFKLFFVGFARDLWVGNRYPPNARTQQKKFKNSLGQWSMLVDLLDPQRSFKTIQEHPT
jgi:hypothetical protein